MKRHSRAGHGRRAVILFLLIALPFLAAPGCSVSRPTGKPEKTLVEENAPVFDKRFKDLAYEDLDLSRLWHEAPPGEAREPVPIHNRTIADLTERVKRGVVNLYTLRLEERKVRFGISPNELLPIKIPLISNILEVIPFRVPIPYQAEGFSLGSGFVIHRDGYILTNAHVVHNATEIRVVLSRGQRDYPARIIGMDRLTDTALLKMPPAVADTALPLGDSDGLRTGEMVFAIGNPLGLRHTVTLGIVSAKERLTPGSQDNGLDFIQTDSAINPGNSGGPLLNLHGEVVGINTAIVAQAQSIGFALPVNTVKEVMPLLVLGKTERGWFGAKAEPLGMDDALRLDYTGPAQVIVKGVEEASPAAKAGLAVDDIITAMDGKPLSSFSVFRRKLLGMAPGREIRLTVFRKGEEVVLSGRLAPPPE